MEFPAVLPEYPFTFREAARRGIHGQQLARLCDAGVLTRLRCGIYLLTRVWDAADPAERQRLMVEGVLARRRGAVASHVSALLLHRLPVVANPLWRIDVMQDVARPVERSGVHVHPLLGLPMMAELPAVPVGVALAQTAALGWRETAVAAGDAALHAGRVTIEELAEGLALVKRGWKRAESIIPLLEGRTESPGESLLRLKMLDAGLAVEPQVSIDIDDGTARVDFLVSDPRGGGRFVVVEFDGRVKYADDATGTVLFREKLREDSLRRRGYAVVRVVWADLVKFDVVLARIRAALRP